MRANIKGLIARLDPYCTRALEAASGLCVNRSHYEVAVEHMLLQVLDDPQADIQLVLRHFEIDPAHWIKQLQQEVEGLRDGNPGKPVFASTLLNWFEDAWMMSSIEFTQQQIRSAALLASLADNPMRYGADYLEDINKISVEEISKQLDSIIEVSSEQSRAAAAVGATGAAAPSGDTAIARFTTNFTRRAREGKIDPVFGRDREIRQMIDIFGRRRKNNPIAVGDAGVGKTAVIEGLALKVAQDDVPDIIKGVDIIGLDLGLLQAGASVKGEFENRLTAVINEIKSSETPIILFIDEAHTLIGAGGAAGTGDAANLLKPALARGEMRTVAATTWSEYKKYFEKDPALARRFQLVKLDEPSIETTAVILRGLRDVYEKAHNVYVRDEAMDTAAVMSARYVSGRQLPDKAVDVLDTACARVNISLTTRPAAIEDLEHKTQVLEREAKAIERDITTGRSDEQDRLDELQQTIRKNREEIDRETEDWKQQQALADRVVALRQKSNEDESVRGELAKAIDELDEFQKDRPKIAYEVTADVVAQVVSDWTGVPLGNMVSGEADMLLGFNSSMKQWVKGQDHAIDIIDAGIRTAKVGLGSPDQPMGIFLFVGPSGVGKTETGLGVAHMMFGGEQFVTTVNMSEYQEKHTVSRLIGSPPGYVGYGEGGVLTEAIRQRPYSVILLDEVEKADLEVMNLFYQVFDKGKLSDGEGREIDFRNTIIFLTSNLASATIMRACESDRPPSMDELTEMIRPELQAHFKPALLGRMTVVPFYPLRGEVLASIVRMKLDKVGKRLRSSQGMEFEYHEDVVKQIADRCTDIESGARNIDHIISRTLLPIIATQILANIGDETNYSRLKLETGTQGEFVTLFE
jgi:type VI secretion system protein VasG